MFLQCEAQICPEAGRRGRWRVPAVAAQRYIPTESYKACAFPQCQAEKFRTVSGGGEYRTEDPDGNDDADQW